jgi:hypothetical protein
MRAVLPGYPRVRQRGQEAGRAVEVGHLQVGRADAARVVRVRAGPARQGIRRGQGGGPVVRFGGRGLGVEDLDDVHRAGRAQVRQHPAQAGAVPVERVRRVDQAALRSDPGHDVGYGEHVRHPFGEEKTDDVAVGRPDLLPHDDPDAEVPAGRRDRGRGLVVVGDAHHVQAGLHGPLRQFVQGGHGVTGRDRVQVAVDADQAHRFTAGRPARPAAPGSRRSGRSASSARRCTAAARPRP